MTLLVNLLRGVAIGLANIIPGVSGGTMALVLGIYERMLRAIRNIGPDTLRAVFRGRPALMAELRRIDFGFICVIGVGALLAVVSVAKLLTYLLERQHDPTYGFFFGLVLASIYVPYRMIRRKGPATLLFCLVAAAAVVGLTLAVSGEERLASAQRKAALKDAAAAAAVDSSRAAGAGSEISASVPQDEQRAPKGRPARVPADGRTMFLFFLAGAIAISAMLLPGISGSFMLLLMGVYFDVLAAITGRQFLLLGSLAAGCLLGLLVITRLLTFLLARFHDVTMAFMLGLVVGSLSAIWPFKSFGMAGGQRVDMDNILPAAFGLNEALTMGTTLFGFAIVVAFILIERRQAPAAASSGSASAGDEAAAHGGRPPA